MQSRRAATLRLHSSGNVVGGGLGEMKPDLSGMTESRDGEGEKHGRDCREA